MRILLAEDNPVNQKVALRMLERLNYQADVANNGREVLDALVRQSYDIILMDMQMPEMDGLEATRRIVSEYPRERRPYIIALTANAMQGDRERCIEAGMDDYISKPLRLSDLEEAFARCPGPLASDGAGGAAGGAESVIDYDTLKELHAMLGDDPAFIQGLVEDFIEDATQLVEKINASIEAADSSTLERAAHTLKSSSATFGAIEFSALCKELETIGNMGELDEEASRKAVQLRGLFGAVKHELEVHIARQPTT